jgi:NhaP-type Na+/H+ or K+/H+ antiporter
MLPGVLTLTQLAVASDVGPIVNTTSALNMTHPHESLAFMFTALVFGIASVHFISRKASWLPYSCALLLEGMLLAGVDEWTGQGLGSFSRSIAAWQNIDGHLILYAFLPALLFGDAMTLNTHVLGKCFGQCAILAGPGVLIGTTLTALSTYYLMALWGDGWDFWLCCTFGAIASATDPVAVVALLKNLGASPILTMQITGESLLNDGVAIVLFNLFFKGVLDPNETLSASSVAAYFAQVAMGGPLLGWAIARALLVWLQAVNKRTNDADGLLQTMLTFAFAYLIFYVTENTCKVSGVLATVTAGVVLAAEARPVLVSFEAVEVRAPTYLGQYLPSHYSANAPTLQTYWRAIEFAANTLIFMLAGLIIGRFMIDSATASDWAHMVVLYVLANVIRAVMVLACYPALQRTGYGTTPKNAAFMVWGGLRGAVGLALALSAHQTVKAAGGDTRRTALLVFFSGGMALFTLAVNGTFAASVLERLGLVAVPKAKELLFQTAKQQIARATRDALAEFVEEGRFSLDDPRLKRKVLARLEQVPTLPLFYYCSYSDALSLPAWRPDLHTDLHTDLQLVSSLPRHTLLDDSQQVAHPTSVPPAPAPTPAPQPLPPLCLPRPQPQ